MEHRRPRKPLGNETAIWLLALGKSQYLSNALQFTTQTSL